MVINTGLFINGFSRMRVEHADTGAATLKLARINVTENVT